MNNEQIDQSLGVQGEGKAAPTGRELDALVAERVMGLVPCQSPQHLEGAEFFMSRPCHAQPDSPTKGGETACYSTDIAAAMEVRDHIQRTWLFSKRLRFVTELSAIVSQRVAGQSGVRLADSSVFMNFTAEDVCRAALSLINTAEEEEGK